MFYNATACAMLVLFSCFNILMVCFVHHIICFITSLLYNLDTLLQKQEKLPVLDITCLLFLIRTTQLGFHLTHTGKETRYIQYGSSRFFCFNITLSNTLLDFHQSFSWTNFGFDRMKLYTQNNFETIDQVGLIEHLDGHMAGSLDCIRKEGPQWS